MNTKQVIVIRKDLKMRRGKEIAQGAHAAMAWLLATLDEHGLRECGAFEDFFDLNELTWIKESHAMICCQVNSESELIELDKAAKAVGLKSYLIQDEGRTEFGGKPTYTCLAIGPDESEKIDLITGNLELY